MINAQDADIILQVMNSAAYKGLNEARVLISIADKLQNIITSEGNSTSGSELPSNSE